ncbi:MAG: transglutaminase-like domain-containing protein [Candidatus Methanomethylophilaceae archaeon]|nr:transglutaminase-like domain-containing protein [Candidatus Methanomethylophilaceae archaeon]
MAAGTYIKALVLLVVSLMVFGFASSTMVHNQIWDGVRTVLGEFGVDGDDGDGGGSTFYEYPSSVSYNLTQTMTVQHDGTVYNFSLNSPIPTNSWNTQTVQTVNGWGLVDSTGFGMDDSIRPGWRKYTYNTSVPSPFSFDIYYNFQSNFTKWDLTPSMSGTVDDIPSWYNDTYVKDQEWVINNNTVGINRSQASGAVSDAIGEDEENVLLILHEAYMWVVSNIDYNTTGGDLKNVSTTIQEEKGDCDDMSTLLISMVRSKGVPAWLEQGILYNQSSNGWEHHAWVQAYVPLANGSYVNITIDPTNKQFALFTPDKLIVYTDLTGDGDLMGEYYNFMLFHGSDGVVVSTGISFTTTNRVPIGSIQVPSNHSTW